MITRLNESFFQEVGQFAARAAETDGNAEGIQAGTTQGGVSVVAAVVSLGGLWTDAVEGISGDVV